MMFSQPILHTRVEKKSSDSGVNINLLPWRECLRQKNKHQFLIGLWGSAIASCLVVLVAVYATHQQVIATKCHKQQLQRKIAVLNRQLDDLKQVIQRCQTIQSRILRIQQLQSSRFMTVHLLAELMKQLPDEVYLTNLERKDAHIQLLGFATSHREISNMMRTMEKHPWIHQLALSEIKQKKGGQGNKNNQFKLGFMFKKPKAARHELG